MARKKARPPKPLGAAAKSDNRRLSNAKRSAYFARRESARVLRSVLQGDSWRQAVSSIKSLVYSPSVRSKKFTFALVCQTLKHLPIIKEVFESSRILNSKWKKQEELMYIIAYDILFGQEISLENGDAEKFLMRNKDDVLSALARLLVRKTVKNIDDLVAVYQPLFKVLCAAFVLIRVRRRDPFECMTSENAMNWSKASSMVAEVLNSKPIWEVLDACSASGNKTVHLAALMRGKGRIIACELNKDRIKRLEETFRLSGAANIEVLHGDFLNLDPKHPSVSKENNVSAILLDPSCSGSGTAAQRLDHLLPSHTADVGDTERLRKLGAFQKKALEHAFSFPAVERVVYSTCSINQIENEDVINLVLPIAASHGFQLVTSFPQWQRRGLPTFEASDHLLRMDPVEDREAFFIALFMKKGSVNDSELTRSKNIHRSISAKNGCFKHSGLVNKKKTLMPILYRGIFRIWLHPNLAVKRRIINR